MHKHYRKNIDSAVTTSIRPTLIDFISKIKKRSLQDENLNYEDIDCGCSKDYTFTDTIGEHLGEKLDTDKGNGTNRELEEM